MTDLENFVILMCPPKSQYDVQPADISLCRLIDCPQCNNLMWFSQKKEGMKALAEALDKNILLCCFICLEKMVLENPHIFKDVVKIKL